MVTGVCQVFRVFSILQQSVACGVYFNPTFTNVISCTREGSISPACLGKEYGRFPNSASCVVFS